MKCFITAKVPTVHQLQSIRNFGLPTIQGADGSVEIAYPCNTIAEAKKLLLDRLYDLRIKGDVSLAEYKYSSRTIRANWYLSLDGVTATIEPTNEQQHTYEIVKINS